MSHRYTLAAVVAVAMAVAFVSGASIMPGTAKPPVDVKAEVAKPAVVVGHKTAVFNMAAVMRDFHQAKYQVWLLNGKKVEISKQLMVWRGEYIQHQQDIQKNPKHPELEKKTKRMLELARKIEDEDRDINKQLNDDASAIIGDLYDKMKTVVDKTAEAEGFQLVLAYPDAVTAEEMKSPYIKELKLKPPAAQPFHIAPSIDITSRVIDRLNEKYPPLDEKGRPVDVSMLDLPTPPPDAPKVELPPGAILPKPLSFEVPADKAPPVPLPPVPSVPGALPKSDKPLPIPPVPKVRP
jgi:Skp family chaperone for outer membrane proteins